MMNRKLNPGAGTATGAQVELDSATTLAQLDERRTAVVALVLTLADRAAALDLYGLALVSAGIEDVMQALDEAVAA